MARQNISAGCLQMPIHGGDLRSELVSRVNVERARRLDALVVTLGGVSYDADGPSRENLSGLLTAAAAGVPVPWPIPWRCADNVIRDVSHADAVALSAAFIQAIQVIYAASWSLKDRVIPELDLAGLQSCDVAADAWWQS